MPVSESQCWAVGDAPSRSQMSSPNPFGSLLACFITPSGLPPLLAPVISRRDQARVIGALGFVRLRPGLVPPVVHTRRQIASPRRVTWGQGGTSPRERVSNDPADFDLPLSDPSTTGSHPVWLRPFFSTSQTNAQLRSVLGESPSWAAASCTVRRTSVTWHPHGHALACAAGPRRDVDITSSGGRPTSTPSVGGSGRHLRDIQGHGGMISPDRPGHAYGPHPGRREGRGP